MLGIEQPAKRPERLEKHIAGEETVWDTGSGHGDSLESLPDGGGLDEDSGKFGGLM
jgi:hypothetical protein